MDFVVSQGISQFYFLLFTIKSPLYSYFVFQVNWFWNVHWSGTYLLTTHYGDPIKRFQFEKQGWKKPNAHVKGKQIVKKLRGPNPTHQNLTPMHPKQRPDKDLTLLHFRFILFLLLSPSIYPFALPLFCPLPSNTHCYSPSNTHAFVPPCPQ